jgi:hypothetical protein
MATNAVKSDSSSTVNCRPVIVRLPDKRSDEWAAEVDRAFIAGCFEQASFFEHSL